MPDQSLSLNLRYFAILREQRGVDQETVITQAATPQALYDQLAGQFSFTLPGSAVRVAVNDQFVDMDTPLHNQDTVVFIPPVAGG